MEKVLECLIHPPKPQRPPSLSAVRPQALRDRQADLVRGATLDAARIDALHLVHVGRPALNCAVGVIHLAVGRRIQLRKRSAAICRSVDVITRDWVSRAARSIPTQIDGVLDRRTGAA
jgi:hypothetical protein